MFHQTSIDNDNDQYCHLVIGDILLHQEIKSTPIQVQVLTRISSQIFDKPNIPHVISNPTETINNSIKVLCDLKNPTTSKLKYQRTISTKNLNRIHKASYELMKKLKTKVITINRSESNISTVNIDSNNKQTYF